MSKKDYPCSGAIFGCVLLGRNCSGYNKQYTECKEFKKGNLIRNYNPDINIESQYLIKMNDKRAKKRRSTRELNKGKKKQNLTSTIDNREETTKTNNNNNDKDNVIKAKVDEF